MPGPPRGAGRITFTLVEITEPSAQPFEGGPDDNGPGADQEFIRGDANTDGSIDLSVGVFLLRFLFTDGSEPQCFEAANFNDGDDVDVSTSVYLFNYLFLGRNTIPAPFPECGQDPTPGGGCDFYPDCQS